jgi:hypothetical protein
VSVGCFGIVARIRRRQGGGPAAQSASGHCRLMGCCWW